MIDLNHLDIKVEGPDEEDAAHSWITITSSAYTDQGPAINGVTLGEVHAARVRAKGVLARLALLAADHVSLEARDHGCHPTVRGEALSTARHDPTTCHISGFSDAGHPYDSLAEWLSLSISIPNDEVGRWLEAVAGWLHELQVSDTIENPDEVLEDA